MTRETARLKGKLAGRKRPLEESYQSKSASDEEGESRATAIKKKARQDPFDVTHGKKRKKDKLKESERSSQPAVPSRPFDESKLDSSDEIEGLLKATDGPDEQSSPIKKNLASAKPTPERKDFSIVELKAISPSPSDETGSKSIQDTSSLSPAQSIRKCMSWLYKCGEILTPLFRTFNCCWRVKHQDPKATQESSAGVAESTSFESQRTAK